MGKLMVVLLSMIPILVTGCWSRREINELAFVTAIAVDQEAERGEYRITVQVAKPKMFAKEAQAGAGMEKKFELYTATGATPADAVRNLSQQVPRRLLFAHNRLVIFGEGVARSGVLPSLDYFEREGQLRFLAWVLVARGKAQELLKPEVDLENLPAESITRLIKYREEVSKAYASNMRNLLNALNAEGKSPVASRVDILPGVGKNVKPKARLTGAAAFKQDKLVGWLSEKETRGLLWITGQFKTGVITVDLPELGGKASFKAERSKSKITPELRDGRWFMTIEIKTEGDLGDQTCVKNVVEPGRIETMETRVAAVIKQDVLAALRKAQQEYKTDIFGFGQIISRRYPRDWRMIKGNWETIYPMVTVDVKVKTQIRRTGMISKATIPGKGSR